MLARILDTADDRIVNDMAGNTNDKEISKPNVEDRLWWNARV